MPRIANALGIFRVPVFLLPFNHGVIPTKHRKNSDTRFKWVYLWGRKKKRGIPYRKKKEVTKHINEENGDLLILCELIKV